MIVYNPGKWSILFACALRGSVFPKAFVFAFPCALFAMGLHQYFRYGLVQMPDEEGGIEARVLGQFQSILGFLVVFRSQKAYSRWWEGGTLLQQLRGEWFNSYSCLLAFSNQAPEKREEVIAFQHQIVRLFSLLYGCALQQVSTLDQKIFEVIVLDGIDERSLKFLQESPDRCEVCLQWIQRLIVESDTQGILKIAAPILSRVFNELGNGIVNLNNARKITDFPIPFPLAQMMTVMLLFHASVTPVLCAVTITNLWWCGTIAFIVIFSYWSINYIAVELEMPFGDDLNDLPLHEMQEEFNRSLKSLLAQKAQKVPFFNYNPSIHDALITKETDFDKNLVDYKRLTEIQLEDAALLEKELGKKDYGRKIINKKEEKAHLADSHDPPRIEKITVASCLALPPAPVADVSPPPAPLTNIRTDVPRPPDQVSLPCPEVPLPPINAERHLLQGHQDGLKPETARYELGATSMIVSTSNRGGGSCLSEERSRLVEERPQVFLGAGASNISEERSRLVEDRQHVILGAGRGTAYKPSCAASSSSSDDRLQSLRVIADGALTACDQAHELARIRICIEENLPLISREVQVMSHKKLRL